MPDPTQDDDLRWRNEAIARLGAEGDAGVVLRNLILWLDTTISTQGSSTSSRQQFLTLLMHFAGRELVQAEKWSSDHPVARTVAAAEEYLTAPTDVSFDRYFEAATDSYPFGAGDGCYAVDEHTGRPGDGCRTGAGSLWQVALTLGTDRLLAVLKMGVSPVPHPTAKAATSAPQ